MSRGPEFLALRAGDEKNALWATWADYFPAGVEIVGEATTR
jgi:hypothetical protein